MSLYLWINIATFGTLFLSFDKKVAFYKYFRALSFAIILTWLVFIPWDVYFTNHSYWGFNDQYTLGKRFLNLPVEEWLFFITVPYSCTFIHFVLKAYFKNPFLFKKINLFWNIFGVVILLIGLYNYDQKYTFSAFVIAAIFILIINKLDKKFMEDFLFTYIVALIPFLVVNSILTGSFTDNPVVWYSDLQNFGIRLGTIPIEDTIYNLLLLLMSTYFTHYFNLKKERK